MTRPFDLHQMPPIFGEIKNGKRRNKKGMGQKLDHWLVVKRERGADYNFLVLEKVHEKLGSSQPTSVPIVFLSDDVEENIAGFRGWFEKGALRCGTQVPGEHTHLYKMEDGTEVRPGWVFNEGDAPKCYVVKGTNRIVPPGAVDPETMVATKSNGDQQEVGERVLSKERVAEAQRRFAWGNGNSIITEGVDPYPVACHDGCPIWNRDDRNNRCKLQHTLYFNLASDLPYSDRLFVYRASGVYAQRTLIPSLKMIKDMAGGILAGLRLRLEFRQEGKPTPGGTTQNVPMPAITIGDNYDGFKSRVYQEIERRQQHFELINGRRADTLDDLKQTGLLKEMQSRDALASVAAETEGDEETYDAYEEPKDFIPDALKPAFKEAGLTRRKQEMLVEQYDGDIDKIKAAVKKTVEDMPSIPQKAPDNDNFFAVSDD